MSSERDEEGRQVTPERSFPYDTLVIAIGCRSNDFGTPGVAQHAISLDTTEQASRFHHIRVDLVRSDLRAVTRTGYFE